MAVSSEATIIIDVSLSAADAISAADKLGLEISKLKKLNQDLVKSNQQTSAGYVQNAQAIQKLAREQKSYISIATNATGSNNELRAKLSLLTSQYNALSAAERDNSKAGKQLTDDIISIRKEIEKSEQKIGDFRRNIGNYQSAVAGIKSVAIGFLSIGTALKLVNDAFAVAIKSDSINTTLTFILKSTDEADVKLNDLRATADRLGLNFLTLSQSYSRFAGAAVASNFSLTEADRIFNSVAGAAARFHLSSDQLEGSLLAIQQMISKGNVQAEELRGQLGERLPGAFSIAARAMGVTEKQLNDLLKSGDVLAANLLPKLATELDKTFSLDGNTKIDSLTASTNRLSTAVDTALQSDGVGKLFRQFVDGASNAVTAIDKILSSRSSKEFFTRIFSFDASGWDKYNAAQDAFTESQKRASTVTEPFSKNLEVQKSAVEKLKTSYQEAYHAYSILYDNMKSGAFPNTKKNNEDLEKFKYNAQDLFTLLSTVSQRYNENLKTTSSETKKLTDQQLTSVDQIRKRITELSKLDGSAIVGSELNERINTLKKRIKDLNDTVKKGDTEREAALKRIAEDRIKSELATAQRLLTARQVDAQNINADIDKRVRLYQKYGQDTAQLEIERQSRLTVLNNKFQQENLKTIRTNLNEATSLRISLIADNEQRTFEQQQFANQNQIAETDRNIMALAARIALGEQGLTDVIQSEVEKRNALTAVGDQERINRASDLSTRLQEIELAGSNASFQAQADELQRAQDLNQQRIDVNDQLTKSYSDLVGTIGDLTGKQTVFGKIAFLAQKAFAIQQIILNAELTKSQIILRYEVLKLQATQAASLAGPFAPFAAAAAIAGLSAAEGVEIAKATASEIVQVAIVGATAIGGVVGKAKGGIQDYTSDGKGGVLKGYATKDDTNAYLRSGEAVVVSEAAKDPSTRRLLSDINVAYGGNPYPGLALGGIYGGSGLQQTNSDITGQVFQQNKLNEAISRIKIYTAITDVREADANYTKLIDAATF